MRAVLLAAQGVVYNLKGLKSGDFRPFLHINGSVRGGSAERSPFAPFAPEAVFFADDVPYSVNIACQPDAEAELSLAPALLDQTRQRLIRTLLHTAVGFEGAVGVAELVVLSPLLAGFVFKTELDGDQGILLRALRQRVYKGKNTDQLRRELMEEADIGKYIAKNHALMVDADIKELLAEVYQRDPIPKSELAKKSGMSEVYLHQLFAGKRNPSRNRLISLCVGMGTTVEECQELLRRSGHAMLYPRSRRDAIILYGLLHKMDLFSINDRLFDADEETLV